MDQETIMSEIFRNNLGRLLLVVLMAAAPSLWSEEPPPLSLEETVGLKRVTEARMSPNGDAIAYILSVPRALYEDKDGRPWRQLHVVDLEGETRPYFSGEVDVSDVAWSADGDALFFVGKRDLDADHPNIFRIRLDGGEAEVIHEGKSGIESIHPSPDGKTIAYLATEPDPDDKETLAEKGFKALVYEESNKATRVWLIDIASGEAAAQDIQGSVTAFDWAPGGDLYAVGLSPTPLIDDVYMAQDIFVVNAGDASIRNQIGHVGKLGAFQWSPDGGQIAWIGAEDINDPQAGRLYAASARGGERRELVPAYPGHVSGFHWIDDDAIAWTGHRGLWTERGLTSVKRPRAAGDAPDSGPILRRVHTARGQRIAAAVEAGCEARAPDRLESDPGRTQPGPAGGHPVCRPRRPGTRGGAAETAHADSGWWRAAGADHPRRPGSARFQRLGLQLRPPGAVPGRPGIRGGVS
jgi:hypothetical protein